MWIVVLTILAGPPGTPSPPSPRLFGPYETEAACWAAATPIIKEYPATYAYTQCIMLEPRKSEEK